MAQDLYTLHKEMLKDAGAKELLIAGGHRKYRLPNGHLFVMPSTSVSRRGAMNSLAWLRRELKETHPEIAMRGRNLPKEHIEVVNKPGDAPKSITVSEVGYWPKEFPVPIPHEQEQFMTITSVPIADYGPLYNKPPIRIEEKEMSSLLERAKQALEDTKTNLSSINEKINHLKIEQNEEVVRQLKLEEYITKQEAMVRETEELLDFGVIPPEKEPEPVAKRRKASPTHIPFNLVYNTIFPNLRQTLNGHGFGPDELRMSLAHEGHAFDRKQVANWLGNEVRRPETAIVRISNGRYGFRVNLPKDAEGNDGHYTI